MPDVLRVREARAGLRPGRERRGGHHGSTQGREEGRPPVLVDFGADWCPDCRVLDARFEEPGPATMLAKYHVVTVDVGEFDRNLDIAERYVNLQTSGIPALVVLDPASGRIKVATNRGEFANARTMSPGQVEEFLKRWA
ncbi:thioredoxin family protein [Streptomyces sp. T1317-0309]|nr:thioredoxin family protein [Streptomyces sp. T1317-0309]